MRVAIYCRVSTVDQTLEQQSTPLIDWCKREGWSYTIFEEKISGAKDTRPIMDQVMQALRKRKFEALMIYKLSRLGRNLKHLIQTVEELNNKNIQLLCLSPSVDTKTAQGRFFISIMGALDELERETISENTKLKLNYMKKQGKKLGRPRGSRDKKKRSNTGYLLRYRKPGD